MPWSRALLFPAVLLCAACSDSTDKTDDTGTTPYSTCNLTVATVDLPRQMPRVADSCRYVWELLQPPVAPTTLTYFEVETTEVGPDVSNYPLPNGFTIGVLEDFTSKVVLFEDSVRFIKRDNRKIIDLGTDGWRGWFAPENALPMPSGAWFIDLIVDDPKSCLQVDELTLTYEDLLGDDCGDEVSTATTGETTKD